MSNVRNISVGVVAIASALIASYEGLREKAYLDPVGIPTICYGSTSGVRIGDVKTHGDCKKLLDKEVAVATNAVDRLVLVPLKENEWAAYTSFVYNVGEGNFAKSTLLKLLNAGDHEGACKQLTKWVYAKGVKLNGLVRRRTAERQLCLS